MNRFRRIAWLVLAVGLVVSLIAGITPASANVTALVLHRRTCGTVNAFIIDDAFSEGNPPFWAAFAVDLNGNGVFGEAGEPIKYVRLTPQTESVWIGTQITFPAVPEGSTIAVTAYEVDSAGVPVSKQIAPVAYQCTHRPATNPLPPNTSVTLPDVAIVAKIVSTAITVYDGASVRANPLGGLGRGALVNVLARNQRGDWLKIDFAGRPGWIMWETRAILFGPYATLPVLPNFESQTQP